MKSASPRSVLTASLVLVVIVWLGLVVWLLVDLTALREMALVDGNAPRNAALLMLPLAGAWALVAWWSMSAVRRRFLGAVVAQGLSGGVHAALLHDGPGSEGARRSDAVRSTRRHGRRAVPGRRWSGRSRGRYLDREIGAIHRESRVVSGQGDRDAHGSRRAGWRRAGKVGRPGQLMRDRALLGRCVRRRGWRMRLMAWG